MFRTYTITEYNSFVIDSTTSKEYVSMNYSDFVCLENFILSNSQVADFMNISFKKNIGKIISVKNYVGTIFINHQFSIEILPKIYTYQNDIVSTKKVLLNMLKNLSDMPFKSFQKAFLQVDKLPMLDIFISEFLNQVDILIKSNLLNDYSKKLQNDNFLKGKLDFSNQIKYNSIHKERFFTQKDIFSLDCFENRILKSTLTLLLDYTNNFKSVIQEYLCYFKDVKTLFSVQKDILKYRTTSKNVQYKDILKWCEIFLNGYGFTNFLGENYSYALLFPMQKVFESYVANLVRKRVPKEYTIKLQDRTFFLIDTPKSKFAIIPDIVLKTPTDTIILDTKWKMLNPKLINYGISQQDMYQMYVYAKKYNSKKVILIYPLSNDEFKNKDISWFTEDISIQVEFIEL